MSGRPTEVGGGLRYEADERAPAALTLGLGVQLALITVAVPILIPTAVMRAGGAAEPHLAWAVFAAVAISGVTTALQAIRFGRIGGGHVLVMGSSVAFIGVAITAVAAGGPELLAILVVFAALLQLLLAARLALFRRVLTPAVSGTVIMLVPVTAMPIVFGMLGDVPDGSPAHAAPSIVLVTLLAILGVSLKGTASLRLWAPVIGVVLGTCLAAFFGLYDLDRIAAASWFGLPDISVPGFDLEFGPAFWALLPAFLLTAVIGSIRAISSSTALQRVSWRRQRPVDFRAVQGTVTVDGMSNLLCGVAGTVPNTTYSLAAPLIEITGVAARAVAVATGAVFLALAFLPKALALVLAIPGPVVGAYLLVLVALLFLIGIGTAMQDGMDLRKGVIVGVSFWLGVGVQNGAIFPEFVSEFAGGFFSNGITAGGLRGHTPDPGRGFFRSPARPHGGRVRPLGAAGNPGVPDPVRDARRLGRRHGGAACRRRRGDPSDPSQAGRRERGPGSPSPPAAVGVEGRGRRRARIRRRAGRGERAGTDGGARRRGRGDAGRAGSLAPGAAPPRLVGAPPAIPRSGHRDRAGESPGA